MHSTKPLAAALLALVFSAASLMAASPVTAEGPPAQTGQEAPPPKMLPFPGPTAEQAAQQEAKAAAGKAAPAPSHAPAAAPDKSPAATPKSIKARYGEIIIHK